MKQRLRSRCRAFGGAVLAALLLSSCTAMQRKGGEPSVIAICPSVASVLASLKPAPGGALVLAPSRDACVGDKLRYAAQQLLPGGRNDVGKAQSLVSEVLAQGSGKEADEWRGLALLLNQQLAERRRADADQDKLNQQLKTEQKRANDAQARLQGLKQVEQTMMQRTIDKKAVQP